MRHCIRPAAQAVGFLSKEVRHPVLRPQQDADPDGEATQPRARWCRSGEHQTLPQARTCLHQPHPLKRCDPH